METEQLETWLREHVACTRGLPLEHVDPEASFTSMGLESADVVALSAELEQLLGRPLDPTIAYEYPDIRRLARHLTVAEPTSSNGATGHHSQSTDAVAVIGMSCRFPGANTPFAFWQLLLEGRDAIREVPADRWNIEDLYDPEPIAQGKMNTRYGGFLADVDGFDHDFFGISSTEALAMDPQQRLLLELSWEAMEDANVDPSRLRGSTCGVFVGISHNEYEQQQLRELRSLNAFSGTGNALSVAANRVSYQFDLRGPSLAVDTACSSSLVAVHLAVQSIRRGECNVALAAGVNVLLSPHASVIFSKARMLASDGHCKAFDAAADGYVRGEGAGVVLLKKLSDAIRDGDPIHAVIRGSAMNQDGRTNGLTAPNGSAQEAVLHAACDSAGVAPQSIAYVETHGTGTRLGDPIEAGALGRVIGAGREPDEACWIGAVKSNVGHLESAAGMAGLIKAVQVVKTGTVPPNLHFHTPNPLIAFDDLRLRVPQQAQRLRQSPVRAGVSAFGFGGTNCHVIVESPPPRTRHEAASAAHLVVLSAPNETAMRARCAQWARFAAGIAESSSLYDLAKAAATGRHHHPLRLAVMAADAKELQRKLTDRANSTAHTSPTTARKSCRVAFHFPDADSASQLPRTAWTLTGTFDAFANSLSESDALLEPLLGCSILETLHRSASDSSEIAPSLASPIYVALQIALTDLLSSFDIKPSTVSGALAAAYATGSLTRQEALRRACKSSGLASAPQASPAADHDVLVEIGTPIGSRETLLETLGTLYEAGYDLKWPAVFSAPANPIHLPEYLWDHDAHLRDLRLSAREAASSASSQELHALLGHRAPLPSDAPFGFWTTSLSVNQFAWLADHRLSNRIVLPGAVMLGFAQAAAAATGDLSIEDLSMEQLLALDPQLPAQVITRLERDGDSTRFELLAKTNATASWVRHAKAKLTRRPDTAPTKPMEPEHAIKARCTEEFPAGAFYEALSAIGLDYGPAFRRINHIWRRDGEAFATLRAQPIAFPGFPVSPTSLDAAFQLIGAALPRFSSEREAWVPISAQAVREFLPSSAAAAHVQLNRIDTTAGEASASITLLTSAHERIFEIQNLTIRRVQREESRSSELPQCWLYEEMWEPYELPSAAASSRRVVLIHDDPTLAEPFANALKQDGAEVLSLYASTDTDQLKRVLQNPIDPAAKPIDAVVSLWSLSGTEDHSNPAASCSRLLLANAGLARILAFSARPPRLWLITRGAQSTGADSRSVQPVQAALWGFAQGAALELPDLRCTRLDLDPQSNTPVATIARLILSDPEKNDQFAERSGQILQRRLISTAPPRRPEVPITQATYVITGGTGSLGLSVATRLAERGASRLLLIARNPANQPTRDAILQIEKLGAKVTLATADVADESALATILDKARASGPPIRGIVHAAGALEDGPLTSLNHETLSRVLRAKVNGSRNLERQTREDPLDFFVFFSSAATALGSIGQSAYMAANAYMDALAEQLRAQGRPAVAIQWGPWGQDGMAVRAMETSRGANVAGVKMFNHEDGTAAMLRLAAASSARIVALPYDLRTLLHIYPSTLGISVFAPLLDAQFHQRRSTGTASAAPSARPSLARPLVEPRSELEVLIAGIWQRALNIDRIGVHDHFFELGGDSVFAAQVLAQISSTLNVTLDSESAFRNFTVEALAGLAEDSLASQVAALTDEQVAHTLAQIEAGEAAV